MKIPQMPFGPIEPDAQTIAFLESLQNKWFGHPTIPNWMDKTESISAAGIIGDTLYILGRAGKYGELYFEIERDIKSGKTKELIFEPYRRGAFWLLVTIITLGLYTGPSSIRRRKEQTEAYFKRRLEIKKANQTNAPKKEKINAFQEKEPDHKSSSST